MEKASTPGFYDLFEVHSPTAVVSNQRIRPVGEVQIPSTSVFEPGLRLEPGSGALQAAGLGGGAHGGRGAPPAAGSSAFKKWTGGLGQTKSGGDPSAPQKEGKIGTRFAPQKQVKMGNTRF